MIHIIDYGLGNVQAFCNMYKRLGYGVSVAKSADDLHQVERLILPGVGAFDHAIKLLDASGMREKIEDLVINQKKPVLGICVGMQMLALSSDEGEKKGLGWVNGRVKKFGSDAVQVEIPHMGWNDVTPKQACKLFAGLEHDARFYFLHSFYFQCETDVNVMAQTYYGTTFDCAVMNDNIYGVQFHPEKSHHWGARLLKNFAEL